MTSKEIDEILKSPITQSAKGSFMSIEQLEQIKNKLEESEQQLNYTLSECIKEWNEKGFDVDVYALEIVIYNYSTLEIVIYNYSTVDKEEDEIEISIRLDNKIVSYTNDVELSFDLHHLLSKTLKALEAGECVK